MSARAQTNSVRDGAVAASSSCNSAVTRSVTREMVHARAAEIVFLEGRLACEATMSDFARAKRELTGEVDFFI